MRFHSDEKFRVSFEGGIQGVLAGGVDCVSHALMDLIGRHQTDAGMMMLAVIPIEEAAAEGLGILECSRTPKTTRQSLNDELR